MSEIIARAVEWNEIKIKTDVDNGQLKSIYGAVSIAVLVILFSSFLVRASEPVLSVC